METIQKQPDPNEVLYSPTDVVVTVTMTALNVFVTVLPLKPAVPKEYLYAMENAICIQAGHMWNETLKAVGVELRIKSDKPEIIADHEENGPVSLETSEEV